MSSEEKKKSFSNEYFETSEKNLTHHTKSQMPQIVKVKNDSG